MVCSICGSEGVNKSSCPLYVKSPIKENWNKHPNAKSKVQPKAQPVQSQQKLYRNPYLIREREICQNALRLNNKIRLSGTKIKLNGNFLLGFNIQVTNPSKFMVSFRNTATIVQKLREYGNLYCDIFKELAKQKVIRIDFFTVPSAKIKNLLDLSLNIKREFVKFLVNNRDGGDGGTSEKYDIDLPIDQIVQADILLNTMPDVSLSNLLAKLPVAPSHEPVPSSSSNKKARTQAIINSG